jgi:outer membrane lipoprotein-sorting protein
MKMRSWMVVFAVASVGTVLQAQPAGGVPDVWQRYQDKLSPVADYSVTMITQSGGHSFTSRMWRLAPKMRMEMDEAGMGQMAMIVDPEAASDPAGKGVSYTLFVARKMYMKSALAAAQASAAKADADLKVEELGKETINSLVCDKRRVIVTETATKKTHVVLLWVSSAVRNMPVQVESTEQGVTATIQFRDYNFEKPAANLFVLPEDYAPMGVGMFPGMSSGVMPGPAAPASPQPPPAVPSLTVGSPAARVTVQSGGTQIAITNVPPVTAPAQDAGDVAKQALKDTTQSAVQEGVNQGVKKLFGW